VGQVTNVDISIQGPMPFGTNGEVLVIIGTTKLAGHECRIEQSPTMDFRSPVSVRWLCTTTNRTENVGGFFINPPGGSYFYRSVNVPCP
jgi:hypothetical protein